MCSLLLSPHYNSVIQWKSPTQFLVFKNDGFWESSRSQMLTPKECHWSCLLCNKSGGIDTSPYQRRSRYTKFLSYQFSVRHGQYDDKWCLEALKCQRQISKIRWQDHIRNSKVPAHTVLGPVSDIIKRRRNSVFGHIGRLPKTRQHTKDSGVMLIWLSAILPSTAGSIVQVVQTTDGSTVSHITYT